MRVDTASARLMFLTWLKQRFPHVYEATMQSVGVDDSGTSGLGISIDWDKLTDNLTKVGSAYLTIRAQRELLKQNLERAKQGMPPIDINEAGAVPTVKTQIDVSPEVADSVIEGAKKTAMNVGLIAAAGAGLVALILLRK